MEHQQNNLAIQRGSRLKLARNLANMTRKTLANKYGLNYHTINAWEKGTNCISEQKASLLAKAFKNEGLSITAEWILSGKKELIQPNSFQSSLVEALNIKGELYLQKEIEFFQQNTPSSYLTIITDDALFPLFAKGDYVGGIIEKEEKIKNLCGSFCIIILEDNSVLTRKLFAVNGKKIHLVSINPLSSTKYPDSLVIKYKKVAPISRHWIKQHS